MDLYTKNLLDQYPFLSYLTYGGNEYIGIVQNLDDVITSLYDFSVLKTDEQKKEVLRTSRKLVVGKQ